MARVGINGGVDDCLGTYFEIGSESRGFFERCGEFDFFAPRAAGDIRGGFQIFFSSLDFFVAVSSSKGVFRSLGEKKLKKNCVACSGCRLVVLGGFGSQSDPLKSRC
jgi:hypothetical protein